MVIVGACTTPGCVEQMALIPASRSGEEVDVMFHASDARRLPAADGRRGAGRDQSDDLLCLVVIHEELRAVRLLGKYLGRWTSDPRE